MDTNNLIFTTLSANPEYFSKVIKLIEQEFHYTKEHQFERDFAPLIDPLNFENCFIYIDANTNDVASHLAICPRTLIKDNIETPIALIGGIVTDKRYRNKNLFSSLMEKALRTYQNDVSLIILWSDIEGLYEKFNFHRTGGIIETGKKNISPGDRPSGYEKTNFAQLSDEDFGRIIYLYKNFNEKFFYTLKREEKDWSIIKNMTSIELYISRSSSGEIQKYFCANKGRDLTNIIHELSCKDQKHYFYLLRELSHFKTWLPETEADKVSSKDFFYNAFFRLGSKDQLNKFLDQSTNNEICISNLEKDNIVFKFLNKAYETSHKEFLQYLFGPKPLEEFAKYKLSFYITGTDSV